MNPLLEDILQFSALSTEARARVLAQAQHDPELAPLLAEAQALETLLAEARLLEAEPYGTEALAYFVVHRYLARPGQSGRSPLYKHLNRIARRLEKDEALRAQAATLEARLQQVEAESNTIAHFEHLTGYRVADLAAPRPPPSAADRPAQARIYSLSSRVARWGIAASLVLLFSYSGLRLYSESIQPPWATYLNLGTQEEAQLRGNTALTLDAAYAEALQLFREARASTLGLFPRYDAEKLRLAAAKMQTVINNAPEDSVTRASAYFYLGKIRLAQGNLTAAQTAFTYVANTEARVAGEAQQILQILEDHLQQP